ncbi:MAG: DUF1559 domain-containing protein [Isosphaeraceae bacterium]
MCDRRGFSLIEFLVAVGIIATLWMCLAPALLSARSAAHRVNCLNNLKQIILALEGYRTTYQALPAGSFAPEGPVPSEPGGYRLSWVVSILPYMEQTMMYRSFNFNFGGDAPENGTVVNTRITTLTCPSDGGEPGTSSRCWIDAYALGTNSAPAATTTSRPHRRRQSRRLYLNSRIRIIDVTDGLRPDDLPGRDALLALALGDRDAFHPVNTDTPSTASTAQR